ncbi:MAG: tetratricopeptide repeat protein [Gemmataceae bacterium]|nr:tetratricopeptide repeat protein [Gemmataceae bacterium]
MIRLRVWLLSVAAALLVAGPAMAYSWPLLFGLTAVFGPDVPGAEQPLPPAPSFVDPDAEFKDLLVQVKETHGGSLWTVPADYKPVALPCADELRCAPWSSDCCDPADAYVAIWRKLWQQGRFREAYVVARSAVQADPKNVEARHALVVSQIVNENPEPNAFRLWTQQHDGSNVCPSTLYAPVSGQQSCSGLPQAGTLTPDLDVKTASCDIDLCCPMIDCPLFTLFQMVFGGAKDAKPTGCGPCPVAAGHCRKVGDCTARENANRAAAPAEGLGGDCSMHVIQGPKGPKMIWIVRGPVVTAPFVPPAPVVSRPAPLPPPHLAPPPPPILTQHEGMVIPVPVAPAHLMPTQFAPSQCVQPALYDPAAERCEVAPLPLPALPKQVQITQYARHVHLSSPHYSAQCDRIRGGVDGELILEGNVQLTSRRHGQTMSISAQRVLVNLKDDQFVVEQAEGMEQRRVNIAPVGCGTVDDVRVIHEWRRGGGNVPIAPGTSVQIHGGVAP